MHYPYSFTTSLLREQTSDPQRVLLSLALVYGLHCIQASVSESYISLSPQVTAPVTQFLPVASGVVPARQSTHTPVHDTIWFAVQLSGAQIVFPL